MAQAAPAPEFASSVDEHGEPVEVTHDMTPIFTLNGVTHYIQNRARPSLSYGLMRRIRTEGAEAASAWMMEQVLGDAALAALEAYDEMTPEQDAELNERIKAITMGGAQAPKA